MHILVDGRLWSWATSYADFLHPSRCLPHLPSVTQRSNVGDRDRRAKMKACINEAGRGRSHQRRSQGRNRQSRRVSAGACYSEIAPRSDGETVCEPGGDVKGKGGREEGREEKAMKEGWPTDSYGAAAGFPNRLLGAFVCAAVLANCVSH